MKTDDPSSTLLSEKTPSSTKEDATTRLWQGVVKRRSFLKGLGVAGAALSAGALLTSESEAQKLNQPDQRRRGDPAVPGGGRNHRERPVAAVHRTRRNPGLRRVPGGNGGSPALRC